MDAGRARNDATVNILIVKLSSLGDVVHAMPAVQDIRAAMPQARIDWVVEEAFAPLVQRCEGVQAVIGCELRRWRKSPLGAQTRQEWRAFRRRAARPGLRRRDRPAGSDQVGAGGTRRPHGRQRQAVRDGQPDRRFELRSCQHAGWPTSRSASSRACMRWTARASCARGHWAMSFPRVLRFGLRAGAGTKTPCVAFVHGTSRDDKCWPEAQWLELGRRLMAQGFTLGLPHGNEPERERGERLAAALGPQAQVWPRLDLGQLTDRLAACAGVIGVDSGLSHIAVALDLPHVQIYNFDTAWRTGPPAIHSAARQQASMRSPHPPRTRCGRHGSRCRRAHDPLALFAPGVRRPAVAAPQAASGGARRSRAICRPWRSASATTRASAQPGALWIHAVSLGETRAAAILIERLRCLDAGLAHPAHAWHGHRPGRRRAPAAGRRSSSLAALGHAQGGAALPRSLPAERRCADGNRGLAQPGRACRARGACRWCWPTRG